MCSSALPTSRVSTLVLPRQGAGATFPSAAAGEKQGQLTCSHDFLDLRPVFPIATGGEE